MKNLGCRIFIFTFCLFLGGAVSGRAGQLTPQLQEAMQSLPAGEKLPVIVSFAGTKSPGRRPAQEMAAALKQRAERSQAAVREYLRRQGRKYRPIWIVNSLALRAGAPMIRALARRPDVEALRLDAEVQAPEVSPSAQPAEPNLEAVRAPALWEQGFFGDGAVIAVFDTGVDGQHPDLADRWRAGPEDWFNPYAQMCDDIACTPCEANGVFPCDDETGDEQGHGTAVTGLISGGDSSGAFIGVAPGAQWIAAKIFRDDGTANFSRIHEAFQWVLDHPSPPDIVNNSWGLEQNPGQCNSEFQADIEALHDAGIVVVFAGGNTGPEPDTSISPANGPRSFAVGSAGTLSSQFEISAFSARGPSACDGTIYPETVAPGFHLNTAHPDGSFTVVSGTSFSAPHASGAMALLLSAFPDLSPSEMHQALLESADDLGPSGPDDTYGFGFVNALAAFNFLDGTPDLFVRDPAPPNNDRLLDFGPVPPGTAETATLEISNNGSGLLTIDAVDTSGLQAPFSVISETCQESGLAAGDTCSIDLRFAPETHQAFSGEIGLLSNDPEAANTIIKVTGSGNRPPERPELLNPENGAAGLETTVTFRWVHPRDPDGDPVTDTLLISKLGDFSGSPIVAKSVKPAKANVLYAGFGAFLVLSALFGLRRHRALRMLCLVILIAGLALLHACGSGGGSDSAAPAPTVERERTVADLEPNTLYHWKVVSADSLGATTESPVRTFTTR